MGSNFHKKNSAYLSEYIGKEYEEVNHYDVEMCKNGCKTLRINLENRFVYLHSKYDPVKEAKRLAEKIKINKNTYVLILGLGFGYMAKEVLNLLGDENRLVIIEPSYEIFISAYNHVDLTEIFQDNRVSFELYKNEESLADFFIDTFESTLEIDIAIEFLPLYEQMYPDFIFLINNCINKVCYYNKVIQNTMQHFSRLWHNNFFKNINHILNSINAVGFYNCLENKPAIIVSAGPSLNKNVQLLENVKDKVCIICVYTAYPVLIKNNICPHFIISLDANQDSIPIEPDSSFKPLLIYMPISNSELLNSHKGNKVLAFNNFTNNINLFLGKPVKEEDFLESGGSVACNALDFAVKLGCNKILLIGQDLAYTNNKTHADGTSIARQLNLETDDENYFLVESLDGQQVYTDDTLYTYLMWFRKYINKVKNKKEILFVDATEGGARINGTEILKLDEAILKFCNEDFDVKEALHNVACREWLFTSEEKEIIINKFKKSLLELKKIYVHIVKGLEISKELKSLFENNYQKNKVRILEILNEFKNLDAKLEKAQESVELLNLIFQPIIIELNSNNAADNQSGTYVAEQSEIFYQGLKSAIDETLPLLVNID